MDELHWRAVFTQTQPSEYDRTLTRLKADFVKRWSENIPSPYVNSLDDYQQVNGTFSGGFGWVNVFKEKSSGKFYAIKIYLKENIVKSKHVNYILQEKRILYSIRFPFVVNLEFSLKDSVRLYLGMNFIVGGDLFSYRKKYKTFSEADAKFYAAQVCLALEYLHSLDMIYRDLKPENLLIDNFGYIKMSDFGFTKPLVKQAAWTLCGTVEYMAPEMIKAKGYGKSVDWWGFGVLCYELCSGKSPFSGGSDFDVFERILQNKYEMTTGFSRELKSLIENLLQVDISRRYGNLKRGVQDIKDHPWFRSVNWIALLRREIEAPYVPRPLDLNPPAPHDKYDSKHPVNSNHSYTEEFSSF